MGADSGHLSSFIPTPNRSPLSHPDSPLSCLSARPLRILVQAPSADCRDGCKRPRPPTPGSAPLCGSYKEKSVALVTNNWKRHIYNPVPLSVHHWHFVVSSVSPATGCVFICACIHTRMTHNVHAKTRRGHFRRGGVCCPARGGGSPQPYLQPVLTPPFLLAGACGVTGVPHSIDCSRDTYSEDNCSRPRPPHPSGAPLLTDFPWGRCHLATDGSLSFESRSSLSGCVVRQET